jgi:hypothetical protein
MKTKQSEKSLGQVAYEKNDIGGIQNWGAWEAAPQCVRDSHDQLARIVVKEFKRRLKLKAPNPPAR